MRFVIACAAVVVLLLALARPAGAAPSIRGVTSVGLGMRANQGGVLPGGFRLLLGAGVAIGGLNVLVELDRQIGPDNRIADAEGDGARWYEWVLAARSGRRFPLVNGLALLATGGVALVHATVTGPLDGSRAPFEVDRTNLGLQAGAALMWQSGSLLVVLSTGVTVIPFSQRAKVGAADFTLPPRLEPSGTLGVGFLY